MVNQVGINLMRVYTCWANWCQYIKIDIEAETREKAKAEFLKLMKDSDSNCDWNEIRSRITNTTKE